ncbi:unnamed protein product [Musa hybrid cultivar]
MSSKLQRLHREIDAILNSIIQEHKERKSVEQPEEDLVDVMLRVQAEGGLSFPLADEYVKAIILDLLGGGSETSATILEWAMSELMRNPRVMRRVQEEVRETVGGKGKVTEEDIDGMNYLRLVIKETLRLHPPVPLLLPRECREASEVLGYHIPEKTRVFVNIWALGRDPQYWDNATEFEPERFEGRNSTVDFKGTNFQVRRKFGRSSEVLREQIREVQKLAKRSSSELAKWIVAKSRTSPRVHRMIDGSSPETRRKKRLTHRSKAAEIVLDLIIVSTLISAALIHPPPPPPLSALDPNNWYQSGVFLISNLHPREMALHGFQEGLSVFRPPLFNGLDYTYWKTRMRDFLISMNLDLWNIVENGFQLPSKPMNEWSDLEKKYFSLNAKAMNALFCALDKNEFNRISTCETAFDIWRTLEITHEGTSRVKDSKVNFLLHDFELFRMQPSETIGDMYTRFTDVLDKQQELRRSQVHDHVGSSRVRRKFGRSSEVLREQIREVQKLAKRSSSELAKWIIAKSRSLPEVRRSITEGSSDDRRNLSDLFPAWPIINILSGMSSKLQRLHREIDAILNSIIQEHKERKSVEQLEEDLVNAMLRVQAEGGLSFPLADEYVKAIILDLLGGGSEISTTTLEWAMSELMRNPRVMRRVQEEVRETVGEKGKVTEEDIDGMNYLRLVIKETLRLHPPVPLLLPRECREASEVLG